MKKIALIISTIFLISNSFAQIINFPDANFKAKLLEAQGGVGIAYRCSNGSSFKIDANNNGEIEVSEALEVCQLHVEDAEISDMTGIEYFTNLTLLDCDRNLITTLDASPLTNLQGLHLNDNLLTDVNLSGLSVLNNLGLSNNQLTSLDISDLSILHILHCDNNLFTSLDLNVQPQLVSVHCRNNLLETLDVSTLSNLGYFDCSSNNLVSLYINNGSIERYELDFSNNLNLEYVCADAEQLSQVEDKIIQYGYTNCFTNSICSFIEGGDFFTVYGNVKFDENEDGCDPIDINYPNLRLSFSDGNNSGDVFADVLGDYHYNIQAGTYSFAPQLENPAYFTASPEMVSVTFPSQPSPFEQDFCIEPNGIHPDLDVTLVATDYYAFPGANTSYIITYSNKGTLTQSGSVNFSFDDDVSDYISSNPTISSTQTNLLIWDFMDLQPFETREIEVTLYINSPTDIPPLNEGDILYYTASLITSEIDETPFDNTFSISQEVSTLILNSTEYVFSDYFILYPNPTDQLLNLQIKMGIEIKTIEIYNVSGQRVRLISRDIAPIDVSSLQTGNFFIKIKTNKGVFNSRFIKI